MQRSGIYVLYRPVPGSVGARYRTMVPNWVVDGNRVVKDTSTPDLNQAMRYESKRDAFTSATACNSGEWDCDRDWRVGEIVSDRIDGVRVEE